VSGAVVLATMLAVGTLAIPAAAVTFSVLESDASHTLIEIDVPTPEIKPIVLDGRSFDLAAVEGTGAWGDLGEPTLAVAATLIAIPPTSGVELRIIEEQYGTMRCSELLPVQPADRLQGGPLSYNEAAYDGDFFSPESSVLIGDPAIFRDYRVVPLRVYPLAYNASAGELRFVKRLVVELDYGTPGRINLKTSDRPTSPTFRPLYEELIANYEFVKTRYESDERGKYLIITHDNYYSSILPLADWKHKRGMEVEIAKLSVIGSSSSAIQTYITNAYNNWDVPPEYILFVGDTEVLPVHPSSSGSDDGYCQLAGSDPLIDVFWGRLSCDNTTQANLIVAKTLGYKRTPYMADQFWFKSACLIVRDDYDPADDAVYYADTWHAYDLMDNAGFAVIDTLFRKNGDDKNDVHASVNAGRVFVNYRGQGVSNWWSPFDVDPNQMNPGYKLPVVMSATCGTGSYSSDGYPCETWMRAGTEATPGGAVSFVSTSRVACGVAHLRSVVNKNFFTAIFNLKMHTAGQALTHGKSYVYTMYGDEYEYEGWSVQGDPDLDIWTAYPTTPEITHSSTVPAGSSTFVVTVESGGTPLDKVLVCAYAEGEVYETDLTDLSGQVSLNINPVLADTVWVTVTGHDLYPYEGYAVVTIDGPFLEHESHVIDDSATGNNDGMPSPGETVDLTVTLRNSGPDDAVNTYGILRSTDPYVTLIDTTSSYGTIPGSSTGPNLVAYTLSIAESCPNGHDLAITVYATADESRGAWTIPVPGVTVAAGDLSVQSVVIDDSGTGDGDGVLELGETAWLNITLANDGPLGLLDVAGTLTTSDAYAVVTDAEAYFGDIGTGGAGSNAGNSFRVSVSPNAPPAHEISFQLVATGDGDTYSHTQNLDVEVTLGGMPSGGPAGPDAYGYYAYDTTDMWTGQAPVYDWAEITGVGSIISAITNADAATTVLSLPFTFKYYGVDYTQISVCSNGFVALGSEDYRFGDNSGIPDTHGPESMIAIFWDDLDPSAGGDIYEYDDTDNHRYIVQFDANVHYGGANPETFEVILYDPAYYGTSSGDGEIVLQYEDVRSIDSATVGIENPLENDGIQYVYNNNYDDNAATIDNGMAIKFTTEPPDQADVWLAVNDQTIDDSTGGDGDGIAEPSETFGLILTLLNSGASTASNVTATISTTDPDLIIVDGTADFGSIAGSGTGDNVASPFVITVADAPGDETAELDLHIYTGSRYDAYDIVTITIDLTGTGIEDPEIPLAFALRQNYPNPFKGGTALAFALPRPAEARLEVYNVTGRRIATVVSGNLPAGNHLVTWDGTDARGARVPAGIYFYCFEADGFKSTKKMILLK
jgi:hypothetical protein